MAPIQISTCIIFVALVAASPAVKDEGFLAGPRSDHIAQDKAFRSALSFVTGCGDGIGDDELVAIQEGLSSIWTVLPKNTYGRVDWRLLRYIVHRYYMQQSSLFVRGLEPFRKLNSSDLGTADILRNELPSNIFESVLEGKHTSNGFSLEEAAVMVIALERRMRRQETDVLKIAYADKNKLITEKLNHDDLSAIIQAYMVRWMFFEDPKSALLLVNNPELIKNSLPHWDEVLHFIQGTVRGMEYARTRAPRAGHGDVAMTQRYSLDDAGEAVKGITKRFASFWETECQTIKAALVEHDVEGIGRVPLSEFYGANVDGDWRFAESEAYLKELGALDTSSGMRGPQVIISNYLQGASNCIISTPNYAVCCVDECEAVLNEIEDTVGSSVAAPGDILPLIGNMTNWEDDAPRIDRALLSLLERIASVHGGKIPIHGRLFAQWLHFVFPRECKFPHVAGSITAISPTRYGDHVTATREEVKAHAATRKAVRAEKVRMEAEEEMVPWLSAWTEDEELIAEYSAHMWKPRHQIQQRFYSAVGCLSLLLIVWMFLRVDTLAQAKETYSFMAPLSQREHFV